MKFSVVHKISTYLMAICAFTALALSDELPLPAVLLGALGILGSWFWEPPRVRIERWTVWWNILAVGAFVLTVLAAFTSGQVVVPGAEFLIFLLVAKLFNRRSSRDYQWVYVLTFLMLVAGTTLSIELSYAVCFLGYVVAATWALILFHLRREMEDNFLLKHSDDSSSERVEVERILSSRRIVGPKFLIATSSVSLAIFFLSAMLFLIFPRVGFGFFFQRANARLSFAGFSDGVKLGGHGLIRTDPTVVMRVKISDPRYQGAAAPELHWRGVAFDLYGKDDRGEFRWRRSRGAFGTAAETRTSAMRTRVFLPAATTHGDALNALRQEIYLEPLDTATLFAASTPLVYELENVIPAQVGGIGRFEQNDEVRLPHMAGLRYVAYSDPTTPSRARLAAAADADARRYAAYLQIPPEMPRRVSELAAEITRGKVGPYAKAEAVLAYLRKGYRYTLDMQAPPLGQEPLDFFLFDRKMGHCEYFSTAMAILLRAAGVPTRNTDGFLGGEWNEAGYIAVRAGDAHSWVEVWFEGVGWVTYDPTPPGVNPPLSRGGGSVLDRMRRMLDSLRLQWFKWVIEYDFGRQLGLMRSIGNVFSSGSADARRLQGWLKKNPEPIVGGLASALGLAAAVILWRRHRRRPAGGAPRRAVDPPIVVEYLRATKVLARHGWPRPEAQTPREHAAQLKARGAPGARPYAALAELYYDARYAGGEVAIAEARRLAAEIRDELRRAKR